MFDDFCAYLRHQGGKLHQRVTVADDRATAPITQGSVECGQAPKEECRGLGPHTGRVEDRGVEGKYGDDTSVGGGSGQCRIVVQTKVAPNPPDGREHQSDA
jgi:hypothetical protein